MTPANPPVTLANCDQEPIHIPGLIQPHGVLLALDLADCVVHASANLPFWFGAAAPALGETLLPAHFEGRQQVHQLIAMARDAELDGGQVVVQHAVIDMAGQVFDVFAHRHRSAVIVEFERRAAAPEQEADVATMLHGVVQLFRQQASIEGLMGVAARVVRQLTGFDRVMGYRFRADDSGDVIAEERRPELPPYLGWRYPASDIPAQARRLYSISPMRLIADVDAPPVAVQGRPDADQPLDMSHAVLRAVSPIHLEYLRNIGVAASMSLSIMVEGRLWGMLACHHGTPRQVPYRVRSTCALLTELLAAHVLARLGAQRGAEILVHERLRGQLMDDVKGASRAVSVLAGQAPEIMRAFGADALLVAQFGAVQVHGEVPAELQAPLLRWLAEHLPPERVLATDALAARAPSLRPWLGGWAGALALGYDEPSQAMLVLLRREQVATVDWGHDPNKQVGVGPSGPRLTPPGSFALWRETVRETSEPWSEIEIESMRRLQTDLSRSVALRRAEMAHYRTMVEAALTRQQHPAGAGAAVAPGHEGHTELLIRQVLELAELRQPGMESDRRPVDLQALVVERVEHVRAQHPGASVFVDVPAGDAEDDRPLVLGERARLVRMLDALLDNAVRYGTAGESVVVRLYRSPDAVSIEISNISAMIDSAIVAELFSGTASSASQDDLRAGLGFGLYRAQSIAHAHGGNISYAYDEPFVTMCVTLPRGPA